MVIKTLKRYVYQVILVVLKIRKMFAASYFNLSKVGFR